MSEEVHLATGILKNNEDNILFLRRSPHSKRWPLEWQLPEGKIETEETPAETIVREVKEETGLNVTNVIFLGKNQIEYEWNSKKIMVFRTIFQIEFEGNVSLSEEHIEYRWVNQTKPSITYYKGTEELLAMVKK